MASLSTPVLLIIFNRPDHAKRVFDAIAKAKPKDFLIFGDGPRFPEEIQKCQKSRQVIEMINWDCKVFTNYLENNIGAGKSVSSAIDWAFSKFDELIILEDDCLPSQSFFYFCDELLKYYRNNERIMHISGNNFQSWKKRSDYSYFFSKYTFIWGWATWKRAWKYYDFEMKTWPKFRDSGNLKFFCANKQEERYWNKMFNHIFTTNKETWDYQWGYACLTHGGLSINPNVNLVSNIGYGLDSTHTRTNDGREKLPAQDLWEIKHPPFILQNKEADLRAFYFVYERKDGLARKIDNIISQIRMKIGFRTRLKRLFFKFRKLKRF